MRTTRPRAFVSRVLLTCLVAAGVAISTPSAHAVADRDCGDFASQRAAQIFFLNAGGPRSDPHGLDSDGDGIACETNPGPYYYGTTPPSSPPPTQPPPAPAAVTSRISISLSRTAAIAGEPVVVRAAVAPRMVRTVSFQQWTGRRWVRMAVRTTTRTGATAVRVRTPRAATRYRAVVAARTVDRKRYTAATSVARALRVQRQAASLSLSSYQVAEHAVVTATVRSIPVRIGRPVSLQVLRDGRWRTLATKRLTRSGQLAFGVRAGAAGVTRYRAWVAAFGGAAGLGSSTRSLTAEDVTGPAQPTGLVATPGDGSVLLSWDGASDDTTGYDVYRRISGTSTWIPVETTPSPAALVTGLTNGTPYDFSVVALDGWANPSVRSQTVTAVPAAPPAP